MIWLRRLRLWLGWPTRADIEWADAEEKARHAALLAAVQDHLNALDRKDVWPNEHTPLSDITPRERPREK